MKYEFTKPYKFEDKTYEEIELDFDSLKGSDIANAKKQFAANGNYTPVLATDPEFCALLVAKMINQPIEFMTEMPARDYCAITQKTQGFLLV